MDPYDVLAEIYDAEFEHFDQDLAFWASRSRGRVLDLGCGTGRVAKYLRQRGISVAGLDRSQRMLRKARRVCPGVPFVRSDMARFSMRGFGSAIAAFSSFQFLVTREDRASCLACLRDALDADGLLTLDLFAPMKKAAASTSRAIAATFSFDGDRVTKFESARRDGGVLTLRWEYVVEGKTVADATQRLAILDRAAIEAELEAAGFAVFALHRDWRENQYDERGPRLIVEAAKA